MALEASKKGLPETAIEYLKRGIELNPKDGRLHYMLSAEHAQIGMYDQAIQGMELAVALDPTLHTAQFQLGLLHLTSGRTDQAYAAWAPLDDLGEDNFLYLFKSGLEHLARDEFEPCIAMLQKGISLNQTNTFLNTDMQRVINDVQKKIQDQSHLPPDDDTTPTSGHHAFISAYTNPKG